MARFIKAAGGRFIDTENNNENVSRWERDKRLKVGAFRPIDQRAAVARGKAKFKKIDKSNYIDLATGLTVSRTQRDKILAGGEAAYKAKRAARTISKIPALSPLSKEDYKKLFDRTFGRFSMMIKPKGGYIFNGKKFDELKITKAFLTLVQNKYSGGDIKKLSKLYGIKFLSINEYQNFINRILEWLEYNNAEFDAYIPAN